MTAGTIIRMRQQTTTTTYEKSQTTSAHIDLTNTQKVRQIHQHKIFNINLPVKLFPKTQCKRLKTVIRALMTVKVMEHKPEDTF
jgi:pentose-5-phosphate-3-epimerase